MLLVDDDEHELPEIHILLEECMSADGDSGTALGKRGLCVAACPCRKSS